MYKRRSWLNTKHLRLCVYGREGNLCSIRSVRETPALAATEADTDTDSDDGRHRVDGMVSWTRVLQQGAQTQTRVSKGESLEKKFCSITRSESGSVICPSRSKSIVGVWLIMMLIAVFSVSHLYYYKARH